MFQKINVWLRVGACVTLQKSPSKSDCMKAHESMEKALLLPVNRKYVEGWGRPGDAGVIAVDQTERPLGAAWYRLYPNEAPGYGFISPTIPELTIGVRVDARGQGIGSALLPALIALAQSQGYAALSLSVDRNNPCTAFV